MWSRNCLPFQSTWLHRRLVWGSCCAIFSFLCNVLYSIICLFFFFFEPLFYMSFDFPLLISPLVSLSSLTQYSTLFKSNKSQKKWYFSIVVVFCCEYYEKVIFLLWSIRRVWRYQRSNQNPYIEEQTTQWPKEKVQKTNNDLQNIHIKLKIE
jgi:hypothetical protein